MAVQILYFSTAVAIKTSLILLYFRIFGVIKWFRVLLIGAEVVVALYFIVDVLVAIFECHPVAFYWDKTIKGGKCINENQFYRWNGVANLLIDFMIWSLTLPVIWHLQLNNKQKLSLSGVFLLGLLYVIKFSPLSYPCRNACERRSVKTEADPLSDRACVASVVRVTAFNQVEFTDISWTLIGVATWTEIEQSIGIICACLPTLRPLFGRLLTNIKQAKSGGSSGPYSGSGLKGSDNSNSVPLSDLHYRHGGVDRSFDMDRAGFKRLDEENGTMNMTAAHKPIASPPVMVNTSVTAGAGKANNNDLPPLPIQPQAILTQQTLEQYVDHKRP